MRHADKLTAMPEGLAGGLDFFHLAVFTPGLALPCALAFWVGVMIERRGWHPPIGWAVALAAVIVPFLAGLGVALLAAFVVSLWILFGWLGMRYEDLRARLAALEASR